MSTQHKNNSHRFSKRRTYVFPLIILVVFSLSLPFWGCIRNEQDYDVLVKFVDSTFMEDREFYTVGESVYVHAQEKFQAQMPETVKIKITSEQGDVEYVEAWPKGNGVIPITEIDFHRGSIVSVEDTHFIVGNKTLEVKQESTLIMCFYSIKGQTAEDNAYIDLS